MIFKPRAVQLDKEKAKGYSISTEEGYERYFFL
jgi:hypothetical protein